MMLRNAFARIGLTSFSVCCCMLLSSKTTVWADEVVVPGEFENVEGDGNNGFPFNIANFGVSSMRYQQVYGASDFSDLTGPVLITEIRFRPDGGLGRPFSNTLTDIQINLSTTPVAVDQLSFTFADNVGPDDTVVHDGPLSLSSSDSGAGPRDFDIVIPLSTPFLYNPANGNLLLDVRNYDGGFTTQFDSVNNDHDDDATSRASTNQVGSVDSETATFVLTSGLVTKFVFVPASIPVVVDIKPGSDVNPVNLKSNGKSKGKSAAAGGVLPVAILTTEDFNATETNVNSLLLGDPELSGAAPPIKSSLEDVDGDGDTDLMLHFSILELVELDALDSETLVLEMTGETNAGLAIEGFDLVTVKP